MNIGVGGLLVLAAAELRHHIGLIRLDEIIKPVAAVARLPVQVRMKVLLSMFSLIAQSHSSSGTAAAATATDGDLHFPGGGPKLAARLDDDTHICRLAHLDPG